MDKDLSKVEFYSFLIDESTDIATDHNLVMFMRYVLNGEVCSRFLGLVELPGGTVAKIVKTVLKVLWKGVFPLKSSVVWLLMERVLWLVAKLALLLN